MNWFGKSWGAPVCEPQDHVATPVGQKCGYCDQAIGEGEIGLVMPVVGNPGDPSTLPYHHACLMKSMGLYRLVHVLSGGVPLCGFSTALPCDWPEEHLWVSVMDPDDATCPGCREKLPKKQR